MKTRPEVSRNAAVNQVAMRACPGRLRTALLVLLLLPFTAGLSAQDLDDSRQQRAWIRAPLVWDNVSGSPQYLSGVKPSHSVRFRTRVVTLNPGEKIEFLVPAHELIRVVGCGKSLDVNDLHIWTSNGSGLYRRQNCAIAGDKNSILAAPDDSDMSVARVMCPDTAGCPITIAIYTSRRSAPQLLDYYQCPILGCDRKVEISDDFGGRIRNYTFLPGGDSKRFEVQGPNRLRIETRLKYEQDPEQRQTYWLYLYIDGVLDRVLSCDTLPQRAHRNFVDGCEQLVGRRELTYIDIDCGGKLIEIQTSHPVYLRVDRVGLNLCRPGLNRNFPLDNGDHNGKAISLWDAREFDPSSPVLSRWFLDAETQSVDPMDPIWDPCLNQQSIQAIARNNQIRHGGLRAYMWSRALAAWHYSDADYGNEISVPEMAQRIRERYTLFRDLLPTETDGRGSRRVAFVDRKVRRAGESSTETIVGQQHIFDALGWLPKTRLFGLTQGAKPRLVYRPPPSLGASLLRVVVDQSHFQHDTRLMVRFDNRPPIELMIDQDAAVQSRCLVPTRAEAALASLAAVHAPYDSGLVGGPCALHQDPVPIVRAATAEFIKPADVRQIEIWLPNDTRVRADIGLQYLDARRVDLSESSFLRLTEMESRVQEDNGSDAKVTRFIRQELSNDWIDVVQVVTSHLKNFSASIQRSEQLALGDIWDSREIHQRNVDAVALAGMQQWPAAIECLSEMISHSVGESRRNAILARTNALESAGEYFLADRERRGWLLYSEDPLLKRAVSEQLRLQASDDPLLQEMFAAVAASKNDDIQFQHHLARTLMNNGQYRNALRLQSALDIQDRDAEILLRCSFHVQWWKMFDRTVEQLQDPQQKNLWQGLRSLHFGDYQLARQLLQSAGSSGAEWLQHWQTGHEIFNRLTQTDAQTRLGAIGDWETWLTQNPGPRQWVAEDSAVTTSTGTAEIYSPSRDLRSEYYRATKVTPATIEVHGPVRIRIQARPIHSAGSTEAIDDWLLIQTGLQIERLPITNNYVSQTLSIENDENQQPGQLVTAELDLPAGLNRVYLSGERSDILFRVLSQRAEIPLPVLPPINKATVEAVITGEFGKQTHVCQNRKRNRGDDVRLICRDGQCQSVLLGYLALPCGCANTDSAIFNSLTDNEARKLSGPVTAVENPLAVVSMDDNYRRAIELVRLIEQPAHFVDMETRMRGIADLEKLAWQNRDRSEIQRLLARAKSRAVWTPFLQFDSRAGVYSRKVSGWQPETPALRIRRSLMAGQHLSKYVITGGNDLVLDIEDEKSTDFLITLQQTQVGFVPLSPTIALCTTGGPPKQVTLQDASVATTIRARLESGRQRLSVRHGNPLANHYIAAEIQEIGADGPSRSNWLDRIRPAESSRLYLVATSEEPIRFTVAAPKVLRIDKYENGYTISRVVPILEDQTMVLQPEAGHEELYRVFELEFSDPPLPIYRPGVVDQQPKEQWTDDVVRAVYDAIDNMSDANPIDLWALRSPDLEPIAIALDDDLLLGLQELGTWGFETGYQKRRALDEFPIVNSPGRFFDFKLFRNFYDPWRQRYSRNELIVRPRIGSGPTYGFVHSGAKVAWADCCRKNSGGWGPYDYDWNTYFYNQHAGTPLVENANSAPWSLGFTGRISRSHQISEFVRHRPSLAFFGRALSEDVNGFAAGELDQDIFTQYKSDHPYGLRLADRFIYQNCLDRRWWFRPRLVSNSDQLTPDNLGFQVGTDQLMGPIQFRLSYRLSGYFADNDRSRGSVQNVLNLEWVYEGWSSQLCRNELRFAMQNNLNDGTTSLGINLARIFNHARGYRDFDSKSILFRSIRNERAAKHYSYGN